jgi:hypothetical protein
MTHRALISFTASALIALGGPALAQSQASPSNSSEDRAAARSGESAASRRICVLQETTGSRLQKRVCRTRQQWEREGGLPNEESR